MNDEKVKGLQRSGKETRGSEVKIWEKERNEDVGRHHPPRKAFNHCSSFKFGIDETGRISIKKITRVTKIGRPS